MSGAQWFLLACFAAFAAGTWYRLNQAFPRPGSDSLAAARGRTPPAVLYSLTAAMMPWKKETANLHLPSYILGVAYHAGIFLSFIWMVLLSFRVNLPGALVAASVLLLGLSAVCGVALLVKRAVTPAMRYFSNPDDYFSNLIATGFVALSATALRSGAAFSTLFIYAGILLLYIPVGKLRHAIYFGLARIYLGLFYGRRGVWPGGSGKSWQA
jgi:nitrate reductase gamma subunit